MLLYPYNSWLAYIYDLSDIKLIILVGFYREKDSFSLN